MIIEVDRQSVAMGDDMWSHAERIEVPDEATLAEVVDQLVARPFLAFIAGGRATWILEVDGKAVAVVAQQWDEPRYLIDGSRTIRSFGEGASLMFKYWKQNDPDEVFEELAAGRKPTR